ncbi:MAG: hypothetical protein II378_03335 [Clostridia bacterium]|nr:hypothetical protein [Clostridia bacterium]
MYAKIQKVLSQSYMLIHSDAQITTNPRKATSFVTWDYMIAQEQTQGKCGSDSENAKKSAFLLHELGVEDGKPFLIITESNRTYLYGECEYAPHADPYIAHVNVDGVSYLTEGNVYILNDEGQTIQKI